jgi:hypothetical protein
MLEAFAGPGHIDSHLAPAAGLGLSCAALFIIFHRFFSVSMVTRSMLAEAFVCLPDHWAVVVSRMVSSYRPRNRQQRHQPADQPIE